jgi:hypothetical protein
MGPPAPVVSVAEWAAWRWAGPMSSFLGTASPNRVVRAGRSAPRPGGDGRNGGRPASPGGGSVAIVDGALGASGGCAVVRLAPALDSTLVVLELVHRTGPAGVLVLAPSRARAEQTVARLQDAGVAVAMMPEMWERARTDTGVVVGTRAAAWAPISRLVAVVVLDAHDEAYREERSPTWSAVDVAVERGRRDRAPVVLVTPCPPVSMTEGRQLVTTTRPLERRGWPTVEVVDRTADDPRTGLPGGVHPEPDRSHPTAGLCPVWGAGPLYAVRWGDGPAGGVRWPAVPPLWRDAPGGVRGLRLEPSQVAPHRGHPGGRGALGPRRRRRGGDHRQCLAG